MGRGRLVRVRKVVIREVVGNGATGSTPVCASNSMPPFAINKTAKPPRELQKATTGDRFVKHQAWVMELTRSWPESQ